VPRRFGDQPHHGAGMRHGFLERRPQAPGSYRRGSDRGTGADRRRVDRGTLIEERPPSLRSRKLGSLATIRLSPSWRSSAAFVVRKPFKVRTRSMGSRTPRPWIGRRLPGLASGSVLAFPTIARSEPKGCRAIPALALSPRTGWIRRSPSNTGPWPGSPGRDRASSAATVGGRRRVDGSGDSGRTGWSARPRRCRRR
jgi:hypothetical protein